MYNIAVIGCEEFTSERKISAFIKKIKDSFGTTATISSGGSNSGAEPLIKKYALELGLQYKEYNPSFTGKRMYSACNENYYGKKFHMSHFFDRYKRMIFDCDKLVVFVNADYNIPMAIDYAIKFAEKKSLPNIIIY